MSTVFQEFNLLPERTVAENVFLGREPRRTRAGRRRPDERRDRRPARGPRARLADAARRRVRTLSVAGQQIVEIVKALSYDARIISMDEPTAALADEEVELLYRLVAQAAASAASPSSTSPTGSRRSSTSPTG